MSGDVSYSAVPVGASEVPASGGSALRRLTDEIMLAKRNVAEYLHHVGAETRLYFMYYPGVTPSFKRLVRVYYVLLLRIVFFATVAFIAWELVASTLLSLRRTFGGGPTVHYDTLLNKCERDLFLHDSACGVHVSDGPNSLLCVWEDEDHTQMAAFLNPKIIPDPLSRIVSKEHILACKGRPAVSKVRGTSVTVYYNSVQHPGTVSARLVENVPLAVCIQHAMEFPLGSPCPT